MDDSPYSAAASTAGAVSNYLQGLIARHVREQGLVVWYDPEGHYREFARALQLPETVVARYDGSFYSLRREIEPLLEGSEAPLLVVYVPLDPVEARSALTEAEALGVVLKPGQQPPARNTRLGRVARAALEPVIGEATAGAIEKQVEAGQLSLADVDALGSKGEGLGRGVVGVIFGTAHPAEVALLFLASDSRDAEIRQKDAAGGLAELLGPAFELELSAGEPLQAWRETLARHVLATDLAA